MSCFVFKTGLLSGVHKPENIHIQEAEIQNYSNQLFN